MQAEGLIYFFWEKNMKHEALILVVDDEDIIRNILAKLVHALGYTVLQASNTTQAVSLMRQYKPDLLLLDIVMPGVDSKEVLHLIRSDDALKSTAVILISALNDLDIISSYIEAGADDFLPKPFNSTLLKLKISRALERVNSGQQLQAAIQSRAAFCQQLAHDLNNGLTGIMMSAELMLMENIPDGQKQQLQDIILSVDQISSQIKAARRSIDA